MTKPVIVTRASKGSALTWTEGDTNFTNLRDATLTVSDGTNTKALNLNDTLTFTAGTNITLSVNATTGAVTINNGMTAFNPASPGAIGGTTAAAGTFTTLNATGKIKTDDTSTSSIILSNNSIWTTGGIGAGNLYISGTGAITAGTLGTINNFTIGGTTPAAGSFTTLTFKETRESLYTGGATTGTITPDCANGTTQKITLTGSITFSAFANPVSGQSMTLIVTQPASGGPYTLTSTMKFAGASKTLSTAANAVDILTVFYDGSTYWASLSTGFA